MMRVGLFDSTFRHDVGSVAGKTPAHIQYVRDDLSFTGPTLFTDGYLYSDEVRRSKARVKLGWLHEPPGLIPGLYIQAPTVAKNFNAILTYHPELLAMPGFQFAPYGGVWIEPSDWGLHLKTRLCSMLYGTKQSTEGQRLRPQVAAAVRKLGVAFYGAEGLLTPYGIGTKVLVHKDYAFSIVIEADRLHSLFTEILLDCFALGTIPVFWGAPNIDYYFDERGVLSFQTPSECAEIVKGLSLGLYRHLLPYARANMERARTYAVTDDWLYANVLRRYEQ